MAVADLLYFGALGSAVLFSAVVLLRQFLDGDLTERNRSGQTRGTRAPVVSRSREWSARSWPTRGVIAMAPSHALQVGAITLMSVPALATDPLKLQRRMRGPLFVAPRYRTLDGGAAWMHAQQPPTTPISGHAI